MGSMMRTVLRLALASLFVLVAGRVSAIDNFANGAIVTVSSCSGGCDASATSIVLTTGDGAKLPTIGSGINGVWFNFTDYPGGGFNASWVKDPNYEIVRCTVRVSDTLTCTRAQESTSAATHNTAGKTYKIDFTLTAKTLGEIAAALDAVRTVPLGGTGAATLTGYVKGNGASAMTAASTVPVGDVSGAGDFTKVDDTNVTATLSGTPTGALLKAMTITFGWTGQLSSARGGTENAFFAVSGPASTKKTFTFPNASATVLTDSTLVSGAQGGTGNGFFAVSGPSSTLKTFAFPNASATVLTTNTAVTVAQGGCGATSLTVNAVLKGAGTSPCAASGVSIDASDNVTIPGTLTVGTGPSLIQLTATVVGSLGTCNGGASGTLKLVSDSSVTTFLGTVSGGGSSVVLVLCNGSNWVVF